MGNKLHASGVKGFDFIDSNIKCKDIFLAAMKTWTIPEETDEDKAERIEIEDGFKTQIVLKNKNTIATSIQKNMKITFRPKIKIVPKNFCKETKDGRFAMEGLSLFFYNTFKTHYCLYFNELPDKKLTRLFATMKSGWDVCELYLLRSTLGDPLKLYESWQKFKDEINAKGKDLW